jgi:hypothetical protein
MCHHKFIKLLILLLFLLQMGSNRKKFPVITRLHGNFRHRRKQHSPASAAVIERGALV